MKDPQTEESVIYVPKHAKGNLNHPDCERGVVSSFNEKFIFVKYIRNGVLQHTAQATNPSDLYRNFE
jgi:hypothetical protein